MGTLRHANESRRQLLALLLPSEELSDVLLLTLFAFPLPFLEEKIHAFFLPLPSTHPP